MLCGATVILWRAPRAEAEARVVAGNAAEDVKAAATTVAWGALVAEKERCHYRLEEVPASPMTRVQVGERGRYRFIDADLAAKFVREQGGTPLGTGPWVVRGGPPQTKPLAPPLWADRRPWVTLTPAQRRKATGARDLWRVKGATR